MENERPNILEYIDEQISLIKGVNDMTMNNIRIRVTEDQIACGDRWANIIEVIADSDRFGRDEIMFQGWTVDQCKDYIKRETGKQHLNLKGYWFLSIYEDPDGHHIPWGDVEVYCY